MTRALRQSYSQAWRMPEPMRSALLATIEDQSKEAAEAAYKLAAEAVAVYEAGNIGQAMRLFVEASDSAADAQLVGWSWLD